MIYTIYMKPTVQFEDNIGPDGVGFESMTAVPDGQSRMALIFPPFWLGYHKLWFELAVYILIMFLLLALMATPLRFAAGYLAILPGVYLLLEGNQLRRYKLERNGLMMVGVAEGKNETEAFERFLSSWKPKAGQKSTAKKSYPSGQQGAIPAMGLFAQSQSKGRG